MMSMKCDQCQVGHCRSIEMTYMRKLGPYMVVLPNAPAGRCDVCGSVTFDADFLRTMQTLLENFARDPQKSGRKKASVNERQQDWTPVGRTGK